MMKLCDCERSHNGLGLAGRECDCPAIEDGWTDEQHQVAASYLTGPPSLASRVALLGQGACDCNTKSPDVHMHLPTCRYRQVMELADAVEELTDALEPFAEAGETAGKVADLYGVDEFVLSFGPVPVGVVPLSAFIHARALVRKTP